jgi:hypothetical protein
MIGKPEWFKYRKLGWGIAPKTWQGWVYTAILALVIGFTMAIAVNEAIRPWVFAIVFGIVVLDIIHIMIKLPKVHDERQNYHQMIIERNCSFAAIASLVAIALYQTFQNRAAISANTLPFDVTIIVVLGAMLVTKVISYLYVNYKL